MNFNQAAEVEAETCIAAGVPTDLHELCRRSLGFVSMRLDGRDSDINVKDLETLERDLRRAIG